jgi:hypothetical protein
MRTSPFLIAVLGLAALPAVAQQQCSPQTTRGFWVYTCDGYLTPPPPAPAELLPSRILGTCTASKTALWDCTGTVNLGGQILDQAQALHGQAYNNADCTGTITYSQTIFGQPAPDLNIRYVILDNGNTIKGLPIDSGQVLSCVLNRLSINGP